MTVKTFMANQQVSKNINSAYDEIALGTKKAITYIDGIMRWLDDKQIIRFCNPQFKGENAEFSIVDRPYQKIWFSQLSTRGVKKDLQSPLFDEIVFKGQSPCAISKTYKNAKNFWNDVKEKRFIVKLLEVGFTLNRENTLVIQMRRPAVQGIRIPDDVADRSAYNFIRNSIEAGKVSDMNGTLKYKRAYRLIEI